MTRRALYVVACAAPPTIALASAVDELAATGWEVSLIFTPTAATWVDVEALSAQVEGRVRVHPRLPNERDPLPAADAVLAAPLTFNTLNKWAAGISDTLALGILNEAIGINAPVFAAPVVKTALRMHPAFQASCAVLRRAGVDVLDSNDFMLHDAEADGYPRLNWTALGNTASHALTRCRG